MLSWCTVLIICQIRWSKSPFRYSRNNNQLWTTYSMMAIFHWSTKQEKWFVKCMYMCVRGIDKVICYVYVHMCDLLCVCTCVWFAMCIVLIIAGTPKHSKWNFFLHFKNIDQLNWKAITVGTFPKSNWETIETEATSIMYMCVICYVHVHVCDLLCICTCVCTCMWFVMCMYMCVICNVYVHVYSGNRCCLCFYGFSVRFRKCSDGDCFSV
jgi:preprotein translocase subunit SecG